MHNRILVALFAVACGTGHAQVSDDTPIIEAAGQSITKSDFERMLAEDPRLPLAKARPEARHALGVDIGKAFALEAEARRRGLDQLPSVQLKIRNYTTQLLANEMIVSLRRSYLKDETALKAAYEKSRDAYSEPRVRQILVRAKGSEIALRPGRPDLAPDAAASRAEALRRRLAGGAEFAALAKAESDDLGSIESGGDIGFVRRGGTPAEFEATAFSLPIGAVSPVIRTAYGFHVIRVEERRPIPFDMVKAALANELAHAELDRLILNGYKLNTAYFGN